MPVPLMVEMSTFVSDMSMSMVLVPLLNMEEVNALIPLNNALSMTTSVRWTSNPTPK